LTVDVITTFIDDVLAGKLSPSLKSEPVPEPNDEPVKVIVGK
jgi:protein disulfide-isomerase A1